MLNLKIARNNKGLTQEELGKLVNVQKSAISKYERGEIQPSQEVLIKLSQILNVTTDYLLGNDKSIETIKKSEDITFDDFTYALYDETKELTKEDKKTLLEMARFFKQEREKKKKK